MWSCICKKKIIPKHENLLVSIRELFEPESIRLLCLLDNEGKVLSIYPREDVTLLEIDAVLQRVALIKTQTLKLCSIQNDESKSIHIQGRHTCLSLYDLPDNRLLMILLDSNQISSSLLNISETRALVQAKIGEFVKS